MPSSSSGLSCLTALAALSASLSAQTPPCIESNVGADLQLSDDDVAVGLSLGFNFPFAGRSTSVVSVSSNGFVWLGTNTDSACCNGNSGDFVAQMARIALLWVDLDPSSGGSVHFATFPGRAVVTWRDVPEFGTSDVVSGQVQLMADGSVILAWQSPLSISSHTTLVGITPGGNTPGVRTLDFSSGLPFNSGTSPTIYELFGPSQLDLQGFVVQLAPNGQGGYGITQRTDCRFASFAGVGTGCPSTLPVVLFAASGSRPTPGANFDMIVAEAPAGAAAGAMLYGAAAGGASLGFLGMTGCSLYATPLVTQPFSVQGRYSVVTLPIPAVMSLIGAVFYGQAALAAPGSNPAGVVASNGGRIEIGT